MQTVTDTIARFAASASWGDLPGDVVEASKLHILDTLGVLVAGLREEASGIVKTYVESFGCRGESSLIGQGVKTSAPYAALGNGVVAHALDFDDNENLSMAHPSVTVLPAVLAVGEARARTGKECLLAYVLGTETLLQVGRGVNPSHYDKGWHSTGTLGSLGAATASAKLLGLDAGRTARSIGLAASMSSGLRGNFGTMTKPYHAGHAARSGVEAAMLASLGFTASSDILGGSTGFCTVFTEGGSPDLTEIVSGLGAPFFILSPGVNKKLYSSCGATHPFIEGVLHLARQFGITAEEVDSVECGVGYRVPSMLIHADPHSGLEGKFSLEFCVALALAQGAVRVDDFTDEKVREPGIRKLVSRVRKFVAEGVGTGEGSPSGIITIRMKNGATYSHTAGPRRGNAKNPLRPEEVTEKFMACCLPCYSEAHALRIQESVMAMEGLEDISELVKLFG